MFNNGISISTGAGFLPSTVSRVTFRLCCFTPHPFHLMTIARALQKGSGSCIHEPKGFKNRSAQCTYRRLLFSMWPRHRQRTPYLLSISFSNVWLHFARDDLVFQLWRTTVHNKDDSPTSFQSQVKPTYSIIFLQTWPVLLYIFIRKEGRSVVYMIFIYVNHAITNHPMSTVSQVTVHSV